jgi:phage tail sheath gpL-like
VPIVTPNTIRAEAAAMHQEASDLGLLDSSTLATFVEQLSVTRPGADANRVDVIMSPVFLAQFLKLATTLRPQL